MGCLTYQAALFFPLPTLYTFLSYPYQKNMLIFFDEILFYSFFCVFL